jgi:hypothetical protein
MLRVLLIENQELLFITDIFLRPYRVEQSSGSIVDYSSSRQ